MTTSVRVYINGTGLEVPAGATVRDALRAWDASAAAAAEQGARAVTDSRGMPVSLGEPLVNGSILRVTGSRTAS